MKWFKEKEFVCKCCGELPPFERSSSLLTLGNAQASLALHSLNRSLVRENIEALVEQVLDPARERFGKPIIVNSGYRCAKHNSEVGGAKNSQHMRGEAADIRPTTNCTNFTNELAKLTKIIIENGKFDQIILYPSFVHVSWKRVGQNRREVLKKTANGYRRAAL